MRQSRLALGLMRQSRLALGLALVILGAAACNSSSSSFGPDGGSDGPPEGELRIDLVDDGDHPSYDTGHYPAMYVDSNDHVFASYTEFSPAGPHVKYATNESGRWVTMTVGATGDVPQNSAITRQNVNEPRMCWVGSDQRLTYARLGQEGWEPTVLTEPGAFEVAMGINAYPGEIHILYHAFHALAGDEVGHLIQRGDGRWEQIPHVTTDVAEGKRPALYVRGTGGIHAVYYRFWPEPVQLEHGYYFDDTWQTETVDSTDVDRCATSIDGDGAGGLHAVYSCRPLRYAHNSSAGWAVENVAEGGLDGAIAVSTAEEIRVCYEDGSTAEHRLMYARRAPGGWEAFEVPLPERPGNYQCRIALGSANRTSRIHLLFQSGGALYHADLPADYRGNP